MKTSFFDITSKGFSKKMPRIEMGKNCRLGLGATFCHPHECKCGEIAESNERHGLKCEQSTGQKERHKVVYKLIIKLRKKFVKTSFFDIISQDLLRNLQ